jgi:hypothetical protein
VNNGGRETRMKKKPKKDQILWYIVFGVQLPERITDIGIQRVRYLSGVTDIEMNTFATKKEAVKARKEIIRILRG